MMPDLEEILYSALEAFHLDVAVGSRGASGLCAA